MAIFYVHCARGDFGVRDVLVATFAERAMLLPAFSTRNMRRYVLRTQELVQAFLDKWENVGRFDAQQELVGTWVLFSIYVRAYVHYIIEPLE